MPASALVVRQLFDNLEIDWGRLSGPAVARDAAKNAADREGEGEGKLPEPTLRHMRMEDLRDTRRLLLLYDQAVRIALIDDSEHMQIAFVALAEHALERGTTNPCGLFAYLLRNGHFDAITLRGEDRAIARLKEHRRRETRLIVRENTLQPNRQLNENF